MELPAFIRENAPMRDLTTFGIGGPARWLAEPENLSDLRRTLTFAREHGAEIKVLGGGSNLLVADAGVDAMVIRFSRKGEFTRIEQDANDPLIWTAGAAVPLASLVDETTSKGISGLENLSGIPGRIGGAAVMNCGSWDTSIGSWITKAIVCDNSGTIREMLPGEIVFSYRHSNIGKFVAICFSFGLAALEMPEDVLKRAREFKRQKKQRQPLKYASAGCFFKNPPGQSAGALIDAAECKGMSVGNAEVSDMHANFIINRDSATCADVVELAKRVCEKVWLRTGIKLKPEVAMWGDDKEFACLREEDCSVGSR